MFESLSATLGLYGATLLIGFIAGMFPIISIEVFLGWCMHRGIDVRLMVALIPIAVAGHQVAKTMHYYAGAGVFAMPRGKLRARIEAVKHRIERWNKRPRLIMFVAATTGLPPLYVLAFIARPLMNMNITTFTVCCVAGRFVRYTTSVAIGALL